MKEFPSELVKLIYEKIISKGEVSEYGEDYVWMQVPFFLHISSHENDHLSCTLLGPNGEKTYFDHKEREWFQDYVKNLKLELDKKKEEKVLNALMDL